MNLQLVTLSGTKLDKPVYEVILPTVDGEISVFPDHESLVTLAKPGVIQVRNQKEDSDEYMEVIAISGGVIEINGDRVKVLVDEADHGEEITEAETQAALERAIKMRDEASDQVELEKASQLIDKHKIRLKVADLQRHKRRRNI
ncbi:ATP synthase F1 subunit epsilon [Candidatus Saccharibacteria bacterium]|nr:MAG: ATP synthase F1 subunit epsilon [Candidatus Saccharibacteria bacterium]